MSDKDEKKEGFARKHLNPVRNAKDLASVSHKQAKQDMEFARSAGSEFMRRFKNMFVVSIKQKSDKRDLQDFQKLLQFWGILEEDIPKVRKNMRISIYAVAMMMIIAAIGLFNADDLYFYCLLSALILGGIFKIIMTFWQLWVLSRRQYVSFKDWFTLNF